MRLPIAKLFFAISVFHPFSAYASTYPEATERYEIKQFELIDVFSHSAAFKQPMAIVRDPSGYVHYVIKGSHLGKEGGIVVKLEKSRLVISEVSADGKESLKSLTKKQQ